MSEPNEDLQAQVTQLSEQLSAMRLAQSASQRRARIQTWVLGLGLIFASTWAAATAFNLGSSNNVPSTFAYEGTLVINGAKVTGSYDMMFTVVDASAVEHDFELTGVSVSDGKFAVEIGPLNQSQFDGGDGDDILLKIAVKQNGSYVPLGSGQKLTSVPFAAKASKAVGADDFHISGNLGVGVTSPNSKLEVRSEGAGSGLTISSPTQWDSANLTFSSSASNNWNIDAYGAEDSRLRFFSDGGTNGAPVRMAILENGNVGIGNDGPTAKLDVTGDIKASGTLWATGNLALGGTDISLYNPNRCGPNWDDPSGGANCDGVGRAIIHDIGDVLAINYGGDFDGGTRVHGAGLWVDGVLWASGSQLASDRRYKKDIRTIKDALNIVLSLRGVRYQFRTDEFPDKHFAGENDIGVIAQEVEEYLPELVKTDKDGYRSVSYSKLTPVLVEAIKELQGELEARDRRLTSLEDKVEFLLKELEERQAR